MNSDVVYKNFRTITFEYEKLVSQSNFIKALIMEPFLSFSYSSPAVFW